MLKFLGTVKYICESYYELRPVWHAIMPWVQRPCLHDFAIWAVKDPDTAPGGRDTGEWWEWLHRASFHLDRRGNGWLCLDQSPEC